MLLKKKRTKNWCGGAGKCVHIAKHIPGTRDPQKFNLKKYIRCEVCGQRFKPNNDPCEAMFCRTHDDYIAAREMSCCISQYVPKHKA